MNLTKEEVKALQAYFDVTNINISALVHKIGRERTKEFEAVLNKIDNEHE